MIATVTSYLSAALRMATPLTLAGLGETICEKSGITNIGVEAIMLFGAFFSFIVAFFTKNLALGMLSGILGGIIISMIHAFLSIKAKANQTISGLALNFTALGLTSFLFLKFFGQSTVLPDIKTVSNIKIPLLSKIPILGEAIFNQNIFVYIMLAAVLIVWIYFYKTQWGVNLFAVGEHPRAADSAGLNVGKIRYFACLLNGLLGGLAGANITLAQLGFFQENITAGKGYIALVTVILGRRNPVGVLISSLILGFAEALQFNLQTKGFPIPSQVFSMLPYIVTVVVLLFSIGKSSDPAALGEPYERNAR